MIYQELPPITRIVANQAFDTDKEDQVTNALLRLALHEPDWQWAQNRCLAYTSHQNTTVRRVAIQCIGHLARIHGKLDLSVVHPILERLEEDPELAGTVQDTRDDIGVYILR